VILLWGLPGDSPLRAVREALRRHQHDGVVFLSQHDVLQTDLDLTVGSSIDGRLRARGRTVKFGSIHAAYLRPYDTRRILDLAGTDPTDPAWFRAIATDDMLLSWADITPALAVNRPKAMAPNGSKPYQAAWIRTHGFRVPATLLTTHPAAVLEFRDQYHRVVYKSISGVRSIVSRLADADLERLDDVMWCPTQFQEFILGTDYRVHVVGGRVFACRVTSNADDYRYGARSGSNPTIEACHLPADVEERCVALSRDMGLTVSGLDLRQTPEGAWYCFEVNPSPGFTYFEDATGQAIADAIADLLAQADQV
jgi:glutathione synthase/RimK-type ligase-like ATP-grasp enzyme